MRRYGRVLADSSRPAMTLRFRTACTFAAVLCLTLALLWLLAPGLLLRLWGIDATTSAEIVGRRSAALFLGIGFMMARVRAAPPSACRTALADGFALACVGLAGLGLAEIGAGRAGPGLGAAVAVELLAAAALALSVRAASVLPRESSAQAWSQVASLVPGAHFTDAWVIRAAQPSLDALGQFLRVARLTPWWVEQLMGIRNRVVSVWGLKNLGGLSQIDPAKSEADYLPGDRVGIFTLIFKSADEVLLCDRDRHLDVFVSVHKEAAEGESAVVTVTTVVHVHNWLGRLYMVPVRPAHRVIVRAMTSSVGRPDDAAASEVG